MTYPEFVDWMIYLREETKREFKFERYLAQIAAEVRRSWITTPKKVKTDDFMVEFKEPPTPEERARRSKEIWTQVLGIKSKKK